MEKDLTQETLAKRIDQWAVSTAEGKDACLLFLSRETGEFIGYGGYNTFENPPWPSTTTGAEADVNQSKGSFLTDLGVVIDHKFRRQGYGAESICVQIEYAFDTIGCDVIRAETATDNDPLRAVMQAIGLGDVGLEVKEGWRYLFGREEWKVAKDGLIAKGKWPL